MRGYVFTTFLKHGKQHIGIVPYTQTQFNSKKIYDWEGARHHKLNTKRKLRANTADLYAMATYIDRSSKGYRRSSDAVMQLETWIHTPLRNVAGERAA